jgi:hypothetical protein
MAYTDRGSGSAIMSAIIGLFIAVVLVIKTYHFKLKSLFTGKASDREIETNQALEDKEKHWQRAHFQPDLFR